MSPHLEDMKAVARAYCNLIESVEEIDTEWLQQLATLLPKLHAAVASLGRSVTIGSHSQLPDLDARFEMYAKLHRLLGERDSYWLEFDVAHDGQFMTGSLADDLTDIYCELKQGLNLFQNEPKRVLEDWVNGYKVHWGQHLIDAERHLYTLHARDDL